MDEKAVIKQGGTPAGWSKAKRRQKDRDARWTLKRGRSKPKPQDGAARTGIEIAVPVFGYKSHLNIDRRHRLNGKNPGVRLFRLGRILSSYKGEAQPDLFA